LKEGIFYGGKDFRGAQPGLRPKMLNLMGTRLLPGALGHH
jgi:hypothetical protein